MKKRYQPNPQRRYRGRALLAIALCIAIAQSISSPSPVQALSPPESLHRLMRLLPFWTTDDQRFEIQLQEAAEVAGVPLLNHAWFADLCEDLVALRGQHWSELSLTEQLTVMDEVLDKLTRILHGDTIEYLGFYDDAFVAAIASQLEKHDDDIYHKANQRVFQVFPSFQNDLEAVEQSRWNQVFTAALVDELYGRYPQTEAVTRRL